MTCLNLFVALAMTGFMSAGYGATAPAGSTAECKDGSYYSGSTKRGACSHHGGIKEWYGTTSAEPTSAPQTSAAPMGPPASQPQQQNSSYSQRTSRSTASAGGVGQVWVNTDSKVYHCPGTRYYGTTKHGSYMSENDAIAQGARADHNKPCNR